MSYAVDVLKSVKTEDIPALPREVQRAAAKLLVRLHIDPRIGEPMRERYNLNNIKACRKVSFDEEGHEGKLRYRFVFRNEPDDGAVDRTTVLSIGSREGLAAYRQAATRRGKQNRGEDV